MFNNYRFLKFTFRHRLMLVGLIVVCLLSPENVIAATSTVDPCLSEITESGLFLPGRYGPAFPKRYVNTPRGFREDKVFSKAVILMHQFLQDTSVGFRTGAVADKALRAYGEIFSEAEPAGEQPLRFTIKHLAFYDDGSRAKERAGYLESVAAEYHPDQKALLVEVVGGPEAVSAIIFPEACGCGMRIEFTESLKHLVGGKVLALLADKLNRIPPAEKSYFWMLKEQTSEILDFITRQLALESPTENMIATFSLYVTIAEALIPRKPITVELWLTKDFNSYVTKGGPLPDGCTYDPEKGLFRYMGPEVMAYIPVLLEGRNDLDLEKEIGVRFTNEILTFFNPYKYLKEFTPVVIHEATEIPLFMDHGIAGLYLRWFTDGVANFVTLRALETFFIGSALRNYGAHADPRRFADQLDRVDLESWPPVRLEPILASQDLIHAHYACATRLITDLAEQHGEDILSRVFAEIRRRGTEFTLISTVVDIIGEITGEDFRPRLRRFSQGAVESDPDQYLVHMRQGERRDENDETGPLLSFSALATDTTGVEYVKNRHQVALRLVHLLPEVRTRGQFFLRCLGTDREKPDSSMQCSPSVGSLDIEDNRARVAELTSVIESGRGSAETYIERGQQRRTGDDMHGAVLDFTTAIELDPDKADGYYHRGEALSLFFGFDAALRDLTRAIELDPDHHEAYFERGYINRVLENNQGAIKDFTEAIRAKPDYAEAYHSRGVARAQIDQMEGARDDFSRAIELDPEKAESYLNRAYVCFDLDDWTRAVNDCSRIIELDPENADAFVLRGRLLYVYTENYGRAIEDLTAGIELGQDDAEPAYYRGLARLMQSDYRGAIADLDTAIKLKYSASEPYRRRGDCRFELEEYRAAIDDYTRAVELDAENVKAFYNRAGAHLNLDEYESAVRDYTAAIELDPDNVGYLKSRARAHLSAGDAESATADHKKVLSLDPGDIDNRIKLVRALQKAGWNDEAAERLKAIAGSEPDNSDIYYVCGEIYYQLGMYAEAVGHLNRYLELAPEDEPESYLIEARRMIEEMEQQ